MPRSATQTYANHRRSFGLYHLVALPIAWINFAIAVFALVRHPSLMTAWATVFAFGVIAAFVALRASTIIVQDRLIGLEMRLRLAAVLPPALRPRIPELSLRQMVGLRFASDAELPGLVERCLAGELITADQVKRQVRDWRPDFVRA